jgi:hypothetical protein
MRGYEATRAFEIYAPLDLSNPGSHFLRAPASSVRCRPQKGSIARSRDTGRRIRFAITVA